MKRKKLITTLGVGLMAGVSMLLVGCAEDTNKNNTIEPHVHTYESVWSSDDNYHWHAATCEHTDEKLNYSVHSLSSESIKIIGDVAYKVRECTVCEKEFKNAYGTAVSTSEDLISAMTQDGVVILNANIDVDGTISTSSNIILDLNGHELNATLASNNNSAIQVDGGSLTLRDFGQTGKITSTGYGIYSLNGGAITVESGIIDAYYSALSGNNTTGDVHFTIDDGYLSAEYGPTIYMPGQVDLTISGGTIATGILLRMGQINISGGEICSWNPSDVNSFDPIENYYSYSGNAWFGGAITLIGGTYTHTNATYGNSLNLNITGGNFVNEVSAEANSNAKNVINLFVAGKVEQDINIAISGGTFTSENGKTLNIMDLDASITGSADNAYNNNGTNSVALTITGGTYSDDISTMLTNGYSAVETNGSYVVSKNED